ncbi:hypothetical protein P12x_004013 [Tundrisphaera lichenicola]|uniref:hypothetical protein n=1 Tax=Tundrisphaera lichenicola TaxID=2029860 RepID=UPI003EB9B89F
MLVIQPTPGYNWLVDACERPELRSKIESALRKWFGKSIEIRFVRPEESKSPLPVQHPAIVARDDGLNDDPLIKLIVERFEAKPVRMERKEDPPSEAV